MPGKVAAHQRLVRNPRVLEQRDMELINYKDVIVALQDPEFHLDATDTAILLSSEGELFELNLIAAMVWERLACARTVAELAALVSKHFDIDHDTALSDVSKLIDEFIDLGLAKSKETE